MITLADQKCRNCCIDKITNVFSADCRTAEENILLTTIKCYTFTWKVAAYRHTFRPDLTNRTKNYYMVNLNRTSGFDYFDHRTNCVREFVNISIFEVIETIENIYTSYAPINVNPAGRRRGIGRDFDRSLWPRGRAFELSCCLGGRDI